MPLPYMAAAVVRHLLDDPDIAALVTTRIYTRSPASLAAPCLLVRVPDTQVIAAPAVYRPLVQVDALVSGFPGGRDPEAVAWEIAAAVSRSLCAANVPYQGCHWTGEVFSGPAIFEDKTRGADSVVYRGVVRAFLTTKVAVS